MLIIILITLFLIFHKIYKISNFEFFIGNFFFLKLLLIFFMQFFFFKNINSYYSYINILEIFLLNFLLNFFFFKLLIHFSRLNIKLFIFLFRIKLTLSNYIYIVYIFSCLSIFLLTFFSIQEYSYIFFLFNFVLNLVFFVTRLNAKFIYILIKSENYIFSFYGIQKFDEYVRYLIFGFSKYFFLDIDNNSFLDNSKNFFKLNYIISLESNLDYYIYKKKNDKFKKS